MFLYLGHRRKIVEVSNRDLQLTWARSLGMLCKLGQWPRDAGSHVEDLTNAGTPIAALLQLGNVLLDRRAGFKPTVAINVASSDLIAECSS